jgi:hypothetical protein
MSTLSAAFIGVPSLADTLNKLAAFLSSHHCAWMSRPCKILHLGGAHGSGKSVLLAALAHRLKQGSAHVIYMSLRRGRSPSHMLRYLCNAATRLLGSSDHHHQQHQQESRQAIDGAVLGKLLHQLTRDVAVIIDGADAEEERVLQSAFEYLGEQAPQEHAYVVQCVFAPASPRGTGLGVPVVSFAEARSIVDRVLSNLGVSSSVEALASTLASRSRNLAYLHAAAHYVALSVSQRRGDDPDQQTDAANNTAAVALEDLPLKLGELYQTCVSVRAFVCACES